MAIEQERQKKNEEGWSICKCPICEVKRCRLRELEAEIYTYECDHCGSYLISYETLRLNKTKITENRAPISKYLKRYFHEHHQPLEIVNVRSNEEKKISVDQILEQFESRMS